MPQLEYFIVARSFSVDQKSDRVSVFEILESLKPKRFPFIIPAISAVVSWRSTGDDEGKDFQAGIKIKHTNMDENIVHPLNFSGPSKNANQRLFITFTGPLVTGPGKIQLELSLNGNVEAHHIIVVGEADPAAVEDGLLLYPAEAIAQET